MGFEVVSPAHWELSKVLTHGSPTLRRLHFSLPAGPFHSFHALVPRLIQMRGLGTPVNLDPVGSHCKARSNFHPASTPLADCRTSDPWGSLQEPSNFFRPPENQLASPWMKFEFVSEKGNSLYRILNVMFKILPWGS
jgi:hypothetical protein